MCGFTLKKRKYFKIVYRVRLGNYVSSEASEKASFSGYTMVSGTISKFNWEGILIKVEKLKCTQVMKKYFFALYSATCNVRVYAFVGLYLHF